MKTFAAIAALLCTTATCRAQSDPRAALIHEIVQLHGIDQMVRATKAATSDRADQIIKQMFDQMRTAFPQAPEKMWVAMQDAADQFAQKTKATWTAEEAIQLWEDLYVTDFTVDELRLVLAAAKTPLGQKQIAAGKRANSGLQGFLVERANRLLEEAATAYIAEIQRIVSEINEPPK